MGFFSGLVSGLGSAVGGLVGGLGSSLLDHRNSTAQQQRNIAWEKEQLQNRHQWEVEDLKAAGLNPILSANSAAGSAASAPGSGSSEVDLVRSMKEMALLNSQIDLNDSATAKNVADAQLANEQSKTQDSVRQQSRALAALYGQQSLTQVAQRLQIGAQARLQNANSARAEMDNAYLSKYPDIIAMNNTKDPLMRYGVGAREAIQQTVDYVLSRFANSSKSLTLPNIQKHFDRGFENYGY